VEKIDKKGYLSGTPFFCKHSQGTAPALLPST